MESSQEGVPEALSSKELERQTGKSDIRTELEDKNMDAHDITNQPYGTISRVHAKDITTFKLPAEILLSVLQNLTVCQLLPCQRVSQQFRTVARTALLDKIGGSYTQHQLQHHLRNNLQYHQQHMDDLEQSQTRLPNQHLSSDNNQPQSYSPPSPPHQSMNCDAGYVAPGNIALFLYPCRDQTPTGWQQRQAVHFWCTGIDRIKEQLVFEPILPDPGDCLKFNTNSWNLPSVSSHGGTSGSSHSSNCGISSPEETFLISNYKSPATGSLSCSPPLTSAIQDSPRSSGGNNGSQHYSVIGIKYGDWPEEPQMTEGRWWGGGLHSSMTQQSMVFLPWIASPGGQGSAVDSQQREIRRQEKSEKQRRQSYGKDKAPSYSSSRVEIDSDDDSDRDSCGELSCSSVHRHHMYMSSGQSRNSSAHHHRYLCLHHDQLITDIAAFSSSDTDIDHGSWRLNTKRKHLMATAGSEHLTINYGAKVVESKRCQFCLNSPCKANLEIQVKFDEIRVSLDWILSGFSSGDKEASSSSLPTKATGTSQPGLRREFSQIPAL
ncbi:hypothetical protein BGZ49_009874 [Haplosporangium sp. Z 27]|nr:hypothetical protein BGZ49_009874 [Haplosporangium sp. Z 27]